MAFEEGTFHAHAINGEVGFTAFLAHHALRSLAEAVERIAAESGVDVGERLRAAREDIDQLNEEFLRLSGWTGE